MTPADLATARMRELLLMEPTPEGRAELHRLRAVWGEAWRRVAAGPLDAGQWMHAREIVIAAAHGPAGLQHDDGAASNGRALR